VLGLLVVQRYIIAFWFIAITESYDNDNECKNRQAAAKGKPAGRDYLREVDCNSVLMMATTRCPYFLAIR